MEKLFSDLSASVTELKKSPNKLIKEANTEPVAILNHNRSTAYLVPAGTFEMMVNCIEDAELSRVIDERQNEKQKAIGVEIGDL